MNLKNSTLILLGDGSDLEKFYFITESGSSR